MIYELAIIASFLFLIITFIINTYLISFIKEIKSEKNAIENYAKKIDRNIKIISISILFLLLSKTVMLLSGPDTLLNEVAVSNDELLILVVNFFYAVLWFMILFFLFLSREVKEEALLNYLNRINLVITILFVLDFILEGIVYLTTISEYMTLSVFAKEPNLTQAYPDLNYILILIILLMLIISGFFINYIIKRHSKILRYLELSTLLLFIAIGYLLYFGTGAVVGWNESLIFLLKLFSLKYGFTGFIFLIVLSVTMVANASVVLLFSIKEQFNSEQQLKNRVVNLVKVGYVATCILTCMAIWPHVYLLL